MFSTWAVVIGPFGPLREQVAKCYAVLGAYLESTLRAHANPPAPDVISPETRVRQAIARARLLAARTRQGQPAASDVGQRLLALVEIADQLFWLGAALEVNEVLVPGNMKPWMEVRDQLNRLLRGWSAYFCYGTRGRAYKSVDHHVCGRVRHFLRRRHKVPSRGTGRFPSDLIFGGLGVLPLDYRRGPYNETSRKAGCGKSARPV